MEGYLKKEGYVFSSRRYFVLSGSNLSYYNSKTEREARDNMVLTAASVVTELKSKDDKLKFRVKTDGTVWNLSADEDDAQEGHKWVEAISKAVSVLGQSSATPTRRVVVVEGTEFVLDPRYEVIRRLGNGAYGVVVSATDTRTQQHVAIKKCFNIFQSLSDAKKIAREVRLLRQMDHPNIIKIVTVLPPVSPSFDEVYIVGELMDIDMHNLIYLSREKITSDHVQFFIYQMLCGLHYMHSMNVIHRDLKPSNLLVNSNCDLKICDFGLARGINEPKLGAEDDLAVADAAAPEKPKDLLSEYVVTRWYRAPEILLNPRNYSKPVDMWAVGTICGELFSRKPMFPAHNYDHLIRLQTRMLGTPASEAELQWITREKARSFMRALPPTPRKDFKSLYPEAPEEALDLMEKMLQWDPSKRPTAAQALAHPWFDEVRELDFEKASSVAIDWGRLETMKMTKGNLQTYLLEDIVGFNPEAANLLAASSATATQASPKHNQSPHHKDGSSEVRAASAT